MLAANVRPFFVTERLVHTKHVEAVCETKGTCSLAEQGGGLDGQPVTQPPALDLARYIQGSILIVRRPLFRSQMALGARQNGLHTGFYDECRAWAAPRHDTGGGQDVRHRGAVSDAIESGAAALHTCHIAPNEHSGQTETCRSTAGTVCWFCTGHRVSTAPGHNPEAHRLRFRAHRVGKSPFVRGIRGWSVHRARNEGGTGVLRTTEQPEEGRNVRAAGHAKGVTCFFLQAATTHVPAVFPLRRPGVHHR